MTQFSENVDAFRGVDVDASTIIGDDTPVAHVPRRRNMIVLGLAIVDVSRKVKSSEPLIKTSLGLHESNYRSKTVNLMDSKSVLKTAFNSTYSL